VNLWLGDLEMLLEDGETCTRSYKNLEMLLEDGDRRPPCMPSLVKLRKLPILPTHFLCF